MGINVASPRKPLYINRGVRDAELRFGRSVVIGSVSDFPTLRRGRWVLLDAHGGMASASRPAA